MAFESEIPKELNEGGIYTSKDLEYFVTFNNVKIISEDTNQFYESELIKYRVVKIIQGYVHGNEHRNCYITPGNKEKVYIVQRVY